MPKVGKRTFPYTGKGVKQAKAYAKKTGKSVGTRNAGSRGIEQFKSPSPKRGLRSPMGASPSRRKAAPPRPTRTGPKPGTSPRRRSAAARRPVRSTKRSY